MVEKDQSREALDLRQEASRSRERSIAIVGIIATAVVGLGGVAASWLIARDDRTTQRAIAHDARVYNSRAVLYEEVLRTFNAIDDAARSVVAHRTPATLATLKTSLDSWSHDLGFRMTLFGSKTAFDDYAPASLAGQWFYVLVAHQRADGGAKLIDYESLVAQFRRAVETEIG